MHLDAQLQSAVTPLYHESLLRSRETKLLHPSAMRGQCLSQQEASVHISAARFVPQALASIGLAGNICGGGQSLKYRELSAQCVHEQVHANSDCTPRRALPRNLMLLSGHKVTQHRSELLTFVHLERCWKQFLIWSGASPTARYSWT